MPAACGGDQAAEDEDAEEVAEVDVEEADQAPDVGLSAADLRALTVSAGEGAFPHGSHGEIACAQCHTVIEGHDTHADVECAECHQGPEWLGARVVFSSEECMACHHGPDQTFDCVRCHEAIERAAPVDVIHQVSLSVRAESRPRTLVFEHAVHMDVECGSCHGSPPSYTSTRSCAACHGDHHEADANCGTCHQGMPLETHALDSHEGCGGSGCHTDPATASLPPVRAVCESCHEEQVEHEPAVECADCHFVAWGEGS